MHSPIFRRVFWALKLQLTLSRFMQLPMVDRKHWSPARRAAPIGKKRKPEERHVSPRISQHKFTQKLVDIIVDYLNRRTAATSLAKLHSYKQMKEKAWKREGEIEGDKAKDKGNQSDWRSAFRSCPVHGSWLPVPCPLSVVLCLSIRMLIPIWVDLTSVGGCLPPLSLTPPPSPPAVSQCNRANVNFVFCQFSVSIF